MDNETDDAIATAAERARREARNLRSEPLGSPELLPKAERVVQASEELHELSRDAAAEGATAEAATRETREHGGPDSA